MKRIIYNVISSVTYQVITVSAIAVSFMFTFVLADAGYRLGAVILLYAGVAFFLLSIGSLLLQDRLFGQLRNEVRNEDCGQPTLTQQGRPVPGSLPGKDVLMGIARAVRDVLSGREIEFGPQADLFLKQFGIRRLTELRDSYKVEEEEDPQKLTALDEAMGRSNFAGVNNAAVQDFVIEKNGIQMYIFIEYGIWYVGNFVLFPGDSFPQCIA